MKIEKTSQPMSLSEAASVYTFGYLVLAVLLCLSIGFAFGSAAAVTTAFVAAFIFLALPAVALILGVLAVAIMDKRKVVAGVDTTN